MIELLYNDMKLSANSLFIKLKLLFFVQDFKINTFKNYIHIYLFKKINNFFVTHFINLAIIDISNYNTIYNKSIDTLILR